MYCLINIFYKSGNKMLFREERDWYSGDSSFKYIDRLIRSRSDKLLVCTPYIDRYYLKMLKRESYKKRVMLISSKASEQKISEALRDRRRLYLMLFIIPYSAVLLYLYMTIRLSSYYLLIPILLAAIAAALSRNNRIRVKIIKSSFVHEKIYINDNTAIVGSANLTFQGTHKNIEHIRVISDPAKVGEMSEYFDRLWEY